MEAKGTLVLGILKKNNPTLYSLLIYCIQRKDKVVGVKQTELNVGLAHSFKRVILTLGPYFYCSIYHIYGFRSFVPRVAQDIKDHLE